MNPFYFGTDARRLFGLYTPSRSGAQSSRAVVLCHSWGSEYLRSHRSMRYLTGLLATSGCDVLSFDYFGTGDSAGDLTDADLRSWCSDIDDAIAELVDMSGATRVSVVGLRLGATLAASIFQRPRKDVEALVLWDPIVSGPRYVDNLHRARPSIRQRPIQDGGGIEVLGFSLTEAMQREMQAIDLLSLVPTLPARTLVVVSDPATAGEELQRALASHPGGPIPVRTVSAQPCWMEEGDFGPGAVPVPLLRSIVEWLAR
jgi:uncharacterized protein